MDDPQLDRLEFAPSYAVALWNLIIRPPRRRYDIAKLGPKEFRLWGCTARREDFTLVNARGLKLQCSHFIPVFSKKGTSAAASLEEQAKVTEPRPVVIYLHANASCRLEAMSLIPEFLPLGISLFTFDFAGCGESDGEYVSLGWYERDDLAQCVEHLRKTGNVSSIGLWGRSMGGVTALLHADRDHSIGGIVLDGPFCNLRQLASELAQSDYSPVKVPSWLLSGAISVVRLRILSLCGFDIDDLAPERHVGASFVPAFFIAAEEDDFVAPHHTRKLHEQYNGDKVLESVAGDHNSIRPQETIRRAVIFFCRALRCELSPEVLAHSEWDSLQSSFGRRCKPELFARMQVDAAGATRWLSSDFALEVPFRIESAMQLDEEIAEAGFCICLPLQPSLWGGLSRPPEVVLAYVTHSGLQVDVVCGSGAIKHLASAKGRVDCFTPMLCFLEVIPTPQETMFIRLNVSAMDLDIEVHLDDHYEPEAHVMSLTRKGMASFLECAPTRIPLGEDLSIPLAVRLRRTLTAQEGSPAA